MKILISDAVEKVCTEELERAGYDVTNKTGMNPADLIKEIPPYDALVVRSATKVTSEIINAATNLKVIGRAGAGVDNIDVDAATRRGILVMNTPGGNTVSTAEHTLSMLLALARNIPQANASLRQGKWDRKSFVGMELYGKTIGVVGLGKVGREVAVRCQGFGMRTIGFDPVLSEEIAARSNIELVSIEEIYAQADIITVHTPLNDDTKNLLNEKTLAACKPGVRIVNCARGGIVNEAAVVSSMDAGHVGGYAADVFQTEPPGDHPLISHPKFVGTPHLGASTDEAQEKVARQIALQLVDVLNEKGIAGSVNGEAIRHLYKKELRPFILLGEKLGSLHGQVLSGKLRRLTIKLIGQFPAGAPEAVSAAVQKGVLGRLLAEPVNFINAPVIAKDMGLSVEAQYEAQHPTYTQLVSVIAQSDRGTRSFSGTVFGNSLLRLVECDGYGLEVNPEGNILLYKNVDRPGMLAKVGSELAAAGINIAGLALGRQKPGETALTVVTVDSPVPDALFEHLSRLEGLSEVQRATL